MTILHYNHTKADIMDIMAVLFDIAQSQYFNPFGASSPKSDREEQDRGEQSMLDWAALSSGGEREMEHCWTVMLH